MNYESEIQQKIGVKPYKILVEQIRSGLISEDQLRKIGKRMHTHVNGVFEQQMRRYGITMTDVWERMLDCWYNAELYDPAINGRDRLAKIFERFEYK